MNTFVLPIFIGAVGFGLAAADAAIIGVTQLRYQTQGIDANGNFVQASVADLYLMADDINDAALNVYNADMTNSIGATAYYQAPSGYTWDPVYSDPNYNSAWTHLDSFVSIGGIDTSSYTPSQTMVVTSKIDPSFGGPTVPEPAANAGWYTSSPPSATGRVGETGLGLGVFVGRFSIEGAGDFKLEGHLEVTWHQGQGSQWHQGEFDINEGQFVVVPGAGGSLALLAAAAVRRRRRS